MAHQSGQTLLAVGVPAPQGRQGFHGDPTPFRPKDPSEGGEVKFGHLGAKAIGVDDMRWDGCALEGLAGTQGLGIVGIACLCGCAECQFKAIGGLGSDESLENGQLDPLRPQGTGAL
jgi:hypothetical protein